MFTTLIVFQVLVAAGLIAIVLVQRGPGATMGAAFGAGASGTVFGSRGAGNFLTRTTGWLAVGFFGISLALAVLATGVGDVDDSESAMADSVIAEPAADDEADASLDSALDSLDAPAGEPAAESAGESGDSGAAAADAGESASEASEDTGGEAQQEPAPEPPGNN